ncbi:MAG: 7TM diverse intracellular signaling domain-containing protein [Myxococcota bacterium]|nr:7TM diverse intracellular signaling domain-containing protein [Myxococcota bacterium]
MRFFQSTSYFFLIVACLCLLTCPAAADVIPLDETLTKIPVGLHLDYIEDKDHQLSLNDVQSDAVAERWLSSDKATLGFGHSKSAYWVRFTVKNTTSEPIKFFLHQAYPLIDNIMIHMPSGPMYKQIEVGDMKPFWERPYENRTFIIPLSVKGNDSATYYLRYESSGAVNIVLNIWKPYEFVIENLKEVQFTTLYYGFVLIMIIYNFFVYFFVRRSEYLHYVFNLIFLLIFIMELNGTAFQFLWPGSPELTHKMLSFSLCLALATGCTFAVEFLGLKKVAPIFYKINVSVTILLIICAASSLFLPYEPAIKISAVMAFIVLCMGVYIGTKLSLKKQRTAYFYLLSWTVLILGGFAYMSTDFGLLPPNLLTSWSIHIGSALQITLLSIALSDRINIMRRDLKALSENLEVKVQERTRDLQQTNEALTIARDEIWGEMQLAKKLQTELIPKTPAMTGYDIAAHTAPANEVGGDYYDVIKATQKDWVIIGDVSGHGVSAGLVMMMAQTSIHTALTHPVDFEPSKLLELVNKTIASNVRQLNEDKYMTITVFAARDNGVFDFSGLHQDILVYREKTRTVDAIETNGMWVGVLENIEGMLDNASLALEKGDAMLVYTDGITEAWKKESNGNGRNEDELFGSSRLVELLCQLGHGTAQEIKRGILDVLQSYESDDDITLLVVKRA